MKDENYLYQMGKMAFEFEEHEFFKDIKDYYLKLYPNGEYVEAFQKRKL
jgi:hypothetical protein